MKYLIVGLGNPGDKYANTRHNIGFKVLEELIKDSETRFEVAKLGNVATHKFKGRTLILLQPSTFMNLSGKAVNYWLQHEKIPVENLLFITDDIALPMGKLRLKSKGSDGGHNGLKDIQATLQSEVYSRLRFGVGNEFAKGKQVDYVLGEWTIEEMPVLKERMKISCEIIKSFVTIGVDKTMSAWNNK
jgi:peptidyl-tRNA hydrolase, PTH1 family